MIRSTVRENDYATIKQVTLLLGPCAVMLEELHARIVALEAAQRTPSVAPAIPVDPVTNS